MMARLLKSLILSFQPLPMTLRFSSSNPFCLMVCLYSMLLFPDLILFIAFSSEYQVYQMVQLNYDNNKFSSSFAPTIIPLPLVSFHHHLSQTPSSPEKIKQTLTNKILSQIQNVLFCTIVNHMHSHSQIPKY